MSSYGLRWDQKLQLIKECRKSGLSDQQWCLKQGIPPSTLYYWINRLQEKACSEIPESKFKEVDVPNYTPHQDVVKVNIIQDPKEYTRMPISRYETNIIEDEASIDIEINGVKIRIRNSVDPLVLAGTLEILKGLLC